MTPTITDDDKGTITATVDGNVVRSWSYTAWSTFQRGATMAKAREYAEGWHNCAARGRDNPMLRVEIDRLKRALREAMTIIAKAISEQKERTQPMNMDRLYEILRECTIQLRTGEPLTEEQRPGLTVTTIDLNPHESEARPDLEKVDLLLLTVGVDKPLAEGHKAELVALLRDWPDKDMLKRGPSYIHLGGVLGDQGAAFQLIALGKVLGLWNIITAQSSGATREQAIDAAGSGWVMISGFNSD